jgi:spoIIIJ-associated protein
VVEQTAREIVGEMLGLLGYEQVTFDVRDTLLPESLEEERSLVLSIRGPGTERLLADGARPLNALQFLARLLLSRRLGQWANLLLDVGGDRSRRMRELCQLAEQSAQLVEREGRPVSLPPMTAYERRVVHLALRDHESIATQSIGTGENRKVTVRRKDQLLPEP